MTTSIQICFSLLLLALFGFSVFALNKMLHGCKTRTGKITTFLMMSFFCLLTAFPTAIIYRSLVQQ